ncbi:Golgin subfamily A member 7/ERF4 family-domain-containing protein [Lasiosphaeria miniovina]|uniref:Ras modification protein ERF4 n=1 Tax=Lasiosphaeria miniovina TaxID=1954250 RepID=A0AA40AW84_9PEZI|nr:Golgin subfamily A member 7/ERF4 family-domain-containing protein [Lasiosphaeria miniovina]KAK0723129.1 Golgin subfamily A member 7/ERF4 family-domain-containing protein [Lasiosphaeria miniovina]
MRLPLDSTCQPLVLGLEKELLGVVVPFGRQKQEQEQQQEQDQQEQEQLDPLTHHYRHQLTASSPRARLPRRCRCRRCWEADDFSPHLGAIGAAATGAIDWNKSRGGRGRLGGRPNPTLVPTASTTAPPAPPPNPPTQTAAVNANASASRQFPSPPLSSPSPSPSPSPSQQPASSFTFTPTPTLPFPLPVAAAAPAREPRRNSLLRRGFGNPPDSFLQSPFRTRGAAASFNAGPFQSPLRRLSAARLWNPANSTPRTPPSASTASSQAPARRRRRPSTPPPPPVPLSHSAVGAVSGPADSDPVGSGAGDYPLLTIPEQRQNRHSISNRASLQIERSAGGEQRISLPPSVRHSYDEKRTSITPSPVEEPKKTQLPVAQKWPKTRTPDTEDQQVSVGITFEPASPERPKVDKGKGKEVMAPSEDVSGHDRAGFSQDLERGPDLTNQRHSTASRISGIGSAISSSNSSIMGDPDQQADGGEDWGPQHPCYPHLNPHVPVDSPEYATTRIIRIRRDWLLEGDLAPTFSNLYPEILDPAGVTEQEFRRVIEKLNSELVPIFSPYNWRNILDGMLGLATGWLWEDFGLTGAKASLRKVEKWIEQWNLEMEKTYGADEGAVPPKIIPLRRTGYMALDIQIPDPEIAPAPPSTPGASRSGMPAEPAAAITA